jgi:hypothetical protein
MKTWKLLAMMLFIGIIAVSCKKEEGPVGPQGPAGTNGTDGNANVTLYRFGTQSFTSTNYYRVDIAPAGLTKTMFNTSVLMSYYFDPAGGSWYPVGQVGANSDYTTRQFFYDISDTVGWALNVRNTDGAAYTGTDVTWDSLKLFVIPANNFKRAEADKVDFNNYDQVNNYFPEK